MPPACCFRVLTAPSCTRVWSLLRLKELVIKRLVEQSKEGIAPGAKANPGQVRITLMQLCQPPRPSCTSAMTLPRLWPMAQSVPSTTWAGGRVQQQVLIRVVSPVVAISAPGFAAKGLDVLDEHTVAC